MTSNALSLSISPQGKKSKKVSKSKMIPNLESKQSKKVHQSMQSDFAQVLLESAPKLSSYPLQSNQSSKSTQTKKISPRLNVPSMASSSKPLQMTNRPLTQENLKIRSKSPQPLTPIKTNLNEALALKSKSNHKQKTLRDIQTIAKENQLHLTKLEITTRGHKSTASATKVSKTNPQEFLQSQMRLHKLSTPQIQEKITHKIAKNSPKTKHTPTLESELNQLDKSIAHKSSTIKKTRHQTQTKIQSPQHIPQTTQHPTETTSMQTQATQAPQPQSIFRESALASLLAQKPQNSESLAEEKIEEKRSEKPQEIFLGETKKEMQFKIAQSKETMTHFTQRLKEEIANYKPPFTKLSMELNPQELGKLEITISKKGKELQISINANNPNALQTFIQNQNEFRNTLANAGFSNVDLSFSQGDSQRQKHHQGENNQKRNKNSLTGLNDIPLASAMEIKMVQYA